MNGKEVRAMKDDELKLELAKLRSSIYDIRAKRETESVQDTAKPGKLRKDIARLLTEQRARHLKAAPKSDATEGAQGRTRKARKPAAKSAAKTGKSAKPATKTASKTKKTKATA